MSTQINLSVLTDGKAGDRAQCMGVAGQLSRDLSGLGHLATVSEVSIAPRPPYSWPWPAWMRFPLDPRDRHNVLKLTTSEIIIASGRRTAPYLKRLRQRSDACFTVFLKTPPGGTGAADLIWVPSHDQLRGPNVLHTETGPHALTTELDQLRRAPPEQEGVQQKHNQLGVIVGGPSRSVEFNRENIQAMLGGISRASKRFDRIAVTLSRRTPETWFSEFAESLPADKVQIWKPSDSSPNPYLDILAGSSALVVSGDSHNMVSEALATGLDVFVTRPARLSPKLERFLSGLFDKKLIRTLDELVDETLELNGQPPLDSTTIIAKWIREEYFSRIGG